MQNVNDDAGVVVRAAGAAIDAAVGVGGRALTAESLVGGIVALCKTQPGWNSSQASRSLGQGLLIHAVELLGAKGARDALEVIIARWPS